MKLQQSIVKVTNRMISIMSNAENEAELSTYKVLQPVHFLIACLAEKGGALGEISWKSTLEVASLRVLAEELCTDLNQHTATSEFFSVPVTEDVLTVLEVAFQYMKKYKQVYMNEGHLLKALLTTHMLDHYVSDEDKKILLSLGTASRDMIAYLDQYQFPQVHSNFIRKVNAHDANDLLHFVEHQFSKQWSETIRSAFLLDEPSIYIAFDSKDEIVGFAAFDVYKNRKGYFGPMGVSHSNRVKGIGYSLLHHCLKDMQEIGYEYAIIGGAGPLEFYERACKAVVIPTAY
ncbi:GNAT superfamily N-acetyltransferase [Lysinibacillus parviboronicapiens]|uniref:GNAT superfamily N-acetyltransferase n=1 Tax=Lysinibacillus parviboronicapiens TaxID=436516 RepID=A0ABV2PGJ3_9BACI